MQYFKSISVCRLAVWGSHCKLAVSTAAQLLHQSPMLPAGAQVKEVSENPLANNRGGKFARDALDPGEETSAMETRILESSITKICSLLAVGFGDAGAEVRALNPKMWGLGTQSPRCGPFQLWRNVVILMEVIEHVYGHRATGCTLFAVASKWRGCRAQP